LVATLRNLGVDVAFAVSDRGSGILLDFFSMVKEDFREDNRTNRRNLCDPASTHGRSFCPGAPIRIDVAVSDERALSSGTRFRRGFSVADTCFLNLSRSRDT
jgi:hypothetical protein